MDQRWQWHQARVDADAPSSDTGVLVKSLELCSISGDRKIARPSSSSKTALCNTAKRL
jgi:hypothetical protein